MWTLRLLADKTVELGYIESISHITVSSVLKNVPTTRHILLFADFRKGFRSKRNGISYEAENASGLGKSDRMAAYRAVSRC